MTNRNNYRIVLEEIIAVGNLRREDLPKDIDKLTPAEQVIIGFYCKCMTELAYLMNGSGVSPRSFSLWMPRMVLREVEVVFDGTGMLERVIRWRDRCKVL